MTAPENFEVPVPEPYEAVVDRVIDALRNEGFGVLTRVDIHEAFREKLDLEFRPYTILGACNPELAHRALSTAPEIGLLLPCNVTVEATGDEASLVRITNPVEMMNAGEVDNEVVASVAAEAYERLRRVADAVRGSGGWPRQPRSS